MLNLKGLAEFNQAMLKNSFKFKCVGIVFLFYALFKKAQDRVMKNIFNQVSYKIVELNFLFEFNLIIWRMIRV